MQEQDTLLDTRPRRTPPPLDEPTGRDVEREHTLAALQARMFGEDEQVSLGRFAIDRKLGSGAMGVVYAATDPDLDRKVALKVIRARDLETSVVDRLMLEARALAKLRHPNVVTVYEVGRDGPDRFIVMDLVDGPTMRQWLEQDHDWREVVRLFIEAGEGLRAAHEAGLVHRDFKPDNVLVDNGHARVVDFGLAAVGAEDTLSDSLPDCAVLGDGRLTRSGFFVGTPAYMAPEQFSGEATTKADQYAFCMALYEALLGKRPFAGEDFGSVEAVLAARAQQPADMPLGDVPRWLAKVLRRGLRFSPGKRWPSMGALLDALRRYERRPWRRPVLVAGVGVGLAGAFALGEFDPQVPCSIPGEAVQEVWNTETSRDLQLQFARQGVPHAAQTWTRVEKKLAAYAQGWADQRTAVCEAARERPDRSQVLVDAQIHCLQRRLGDLAALTVAFADADARAVGKSLEATDALPKLQTCADAAMLRRTLERRGDAVVASEESYARLAAAETALRTGAYDDALSRADRVADEGEATGDLELQTRALLLKAQVLDVREETETAEEAAMSSVEAAEALGDTRLRLDAEMRLLSIFVKARAFDRARATARRARATMKHLGNPPADLAWLHYYRGHLEVYSGNLDAALEEHRAAVALVEKTPALPVTQQAAILRALGTTLIERGTPEESFELYVRAFELERAELGESHPRLVRAQLGMVDALAGRGLLEEAIERGKNAVALAEEAMGEDSVLAARAHGTLAIALANAGKLDEAEFRFRRAVELLETNLGPTHQDVGLVLNNLARVLVGRSKRREAVAVLERSKAVMLANVRAGHPDLIYVHGNLAESYAGLDEWDASHKEAARALEIATKELGTSNAVYAETLEWLGSAQLGRGDMEEAYASLSAALAVYSDPALDVRVAFAGRVRRKVALAQWGLGLAAEAEASMRTARDELTDNEDDRPVWRVNAIDAWLASPPSERDTTPIYSAR